MLYCNSLLQLEVSRGQFATEIALHKYSASLCTLQWACRPTTVRLVTLDTSSNQLSEASPVNFCVLLLKSTRIAIQSIIRLSVFGIHSVHSFQLLIKFSSSVQCFYLEVLMELQF